MKLLFDQNLSFKLAPILDFVFPGSKHVKDFGLTRNDDEAIWQLALEQGFVIVSKDSDFLHKIFPFMTYMVEISTPSVRQG